MLKTFIDVTCIGRKEGMPDIRSVVAGTFGRSFNETMVFEEICNQSSSSRSETFINLQHRGDTARDVPFTFLAEKFVAVQRYLEIEKACF
jgi:hypothetical protein